MKKWTFILTVLPTFAVAATLGEEAGFEINTINATDFEVIEQSHMGPTEFWCAAASYHEYRQGRSETDNLYIIKPRGPAVTRAGRRGVVFSTTAPADAMRGQTVTVDRKGATFKSAQARRYCRDAFTRSTK